MSKQMVDIKPKMDAVWNVKNSPKIKVKITEVETSKVCYYYLDEPLVIRRMPKGIFTYYFELEESNG